LHFGNRRAFGKRGPPAPPVVDPALGIVDLADRQPSLRRHPALRRS